jgi:hypothetical protein
MSGRTVTPYISGAQRSPGAVQDEDRGSIREDVAYILKESIIRPAEIRNLDQLT